jgi:hypothetical protein
MRLETRLEQTIPFTAEQLSAGDETAWALLLRTLDECEGNIAATAEALGVAPRTAFRWLERFGRLQAAVADWRPVVTRAHLEGAKGRACACIAWQALEQAVATCHGNVTHVARELGIPLRTLQHWGHLPRLAAAISGARKAGAGVASRLDETEPTEQLSVRHDGKSWLARRGEQTGRGITPTLAIWRLR